MLRFCTIPVTLSVFVLVGQANAEPPSTASSDLPTHYLKESVSIVEGQPWSFTPQRTGDVNGETIAYQIDDLGLVDASFFTYDETTGEVSLNAPLDFERPTDSDQDNEYIFELEGIGQTDRYVYSVSLSVSDQTEVFEDGSPFIEISGATARGRLGSNVVALGDVDRDGLPDIAISAPRGYGQVYFLSGYGLSTMSSAEYLSSGLPNASWQLDGAAGDQSIGTSMAVVGDLDNDGINDLALNRNETEILIISGATIAAGFETGGSQTVSQLDKGVLTLPDGAVLDPNSLAAFGDLTQDGIADLGLCLRFDSTYLEDYFLSVGAVSGAALSGATRQNQTLSMSTLISQDEAGYYGRESSLPHCGPLTVLGDMSDDGRVEIAIPFSTGFGNAAGFFTGTNLRDLITYGIAFNEPGYPPADYFWRFVDENDSHIGSFLYDKGFQIAALGDVTGDDVPDFGVTWNREHPADDLSVIIKGGSDFFNFNRWLWGDAETAVQDLMDAGMAIQLTGPNGNSLNFKGLYAVRPPVDGLHEPLIFAHVGESHIYSFYASDLPSDGSSTFAVDQARELHIPTVGLNDVSVTDAMNIGDINRDGYGDFAVTFVDANSARDPSDNSSNPLYRAGRVYLVSGKALLTLVDAEARRN